MRRWRGPRGNSQPMPICIPNNFEIYSYFRQSPFNKIARRKSGPASSSSSEWKPNVVKPQLNKLEAPKKPIVESKPAPTQAWKPGTTHVSKLFRQVNLILLLKNHFLDGGGAGGGLPKSSEEKKSTEEQGGQLHGGGGGGGGGKHAR